jgi:folylpolyglutamate synthase/dihydropteroate synthase
VLRAAEGSELAATARALGLSAEAEPDSARALARARTLAGSGGLVLVAGSLYLIGEVMALLDGGTTPGPVSM